MELLDAAWLLISKPVAFIVVYNPFPCLSVKGPKKEKINVTDASFLK